jgi:hypothetical protein
MLAVGPYLVEFHSDLILELMQFSESGVQFSRFHL